MSRTTRKRFKHCFLQNIKSYLGFILFDMLDWSVYNFDGWEIEYGRYFRHFGSEGDSVWDTWLEKTFSGNWAER